jgi:hypothetical protein
MSAEAQGPSGRPRWRAPVVGAVAGLIVAAAIIGPAALADSGGSGGTPAKAGQTAAPPPNGVPRQFLDAVAQLVQSGTIDAAQGRAIDAQIETGSMDPGRMVARGVVTASQMAAVNDHLVAVKKGLAQVHADAADGKAAVVAPLSCAAAKSARARAAG